MVKKAKKINSMYLRNTRNEFKLNQIDFADKAKISPRTLQNAEDGKHISYPIIENIINCIIKEKKSRNWQADEQTIRLDLEPIDERTRHVNVDSDYHEIELSNVDPVVPEFSLHAEDPYSNETRLICEDDYYYLNKTAYDVSTEERSFISFCKSASKKEKIWVSNIEIDNEEAIEALKELEIAIERFDDSRTSSSLSVLTERMKNTSQIKDALLKLNMANYQIFEGSQELHSMTVPILFIDYISIKEVSYNVHCVHPRFSNNKKTLPYFTLSGGLKGLRNYLMKYEETPYLISKAEVSNNENDGVEPGDYLYPISEDERKWVDLCDSILEQYTSIEREAYDNWCKDFISKHMPPNVLKLYLDQHLKIKSLPF